MVMVVAPLVLVKCWS